MESRPQFDQRNDAPGDPHLPTRRPGDARNELQQRRLPCAVPADDAQTGGLGHVEADIAERPDVGVDPAARQAVDVLRAATGAIQRRSD